jgi:UDP-glucose 4-epimerase
MAILVTGGAGYIGSHTVLALLERGEDVVVLDNLVNASEESLRRVAQLTGKAAKFYRGDIQDAGCLQRIFNEQQIASVIHFAGLKAVGGVDPETPGVLSKQRDGHLGTAGSDASGRRSPVYL